MSKHTPGPWSNNKWNSEEHQIAALGGTIALVSHSHSLVSEEQADANAALIAAAPELLAACEVAFDLTDKWKRTEHGADFHEVDRVLRAAIAQARGEAVQISKEQDAAEEQLCIYAKVLLHMGVSADTIHQQVTSAIDEARGEAVTQ